MKRLISLSVLFVVLVFAISQVSYASSISIDHVTNVWSDGTTTYITPNEEITFYIRYINNSGMDMQGMANGFRVWTTGGTPFTPLNGEIVHTELFSLFDLGFGGNVFSADGIGADTLGIGGIASTGTGLYDGFNEIVLKLITGGVQAGETLCIDSSYYPLTGDWLWATSTFDMIFPTWSGQQCFYAECPTCIGPDFTNCVDTLRNTDCSTISYQFEADDPLNIPPGNIFFSIIDGPGTIDSVTGDWSYNIPSNKLGTYENLLIGTYGDCPCWTSGCYTILDFTSNIPADFNSDCSINVSDLVFFVAYMFQSGPPPIPLMTADINGDININVSDIIYLISYMFNNGPPPVG